MAEYEVSYERMGEEIAIRAGKMIDYMLSPDIDNVVWSGETAAIADVNNHRGSMSREQLIDYIKFRLEWIRCKDARIAPRVREGLNKGYNWCFGILTDTHRIE